MSEPDRRLLKIVHPLCPTSWAVGICLSVQWVSDADKGLLSASPGTRLRGV